MNAEERAARVRMLVLDVDGVLTDGGLYYDQEGNILKRFNVQDGLGIKLAQRAGLAIGVISGLDSKAVATRVRELGIEYYYPGHHHKIPVLRQISEQSGIAFSEMAYVGDDWVDVGPMEVVGLPMAVANAQPEIKSMALWIANAHGGQGAVREAIRFILQSQQRLDGLWRTWAD
ncbi:KdsC family phosphatase [Desulfoplanes formicivorans]|uniref:3-deoxy-D-manno-octulosonate 8-phosphate phosphatase, YrbI family n=1 Tax=Desulfoplanes formicivorans TaxID=1592317 RepID=A0A194AJW1_9BACT|nr:HAD hydrolase family protein [Desulfoplanes formicivorans]GAU09014.1 3-deoxy-D-manno-octulosonate 8-phosphate phosphatase, YrbI family [Desulfoplanes formicivorans]